VSVDALPVQQASSRLLITLVVDTSSSMLQSDGIAQLNAALQQWRTELLRQQQLMRIGEIAIVTFGDRHIRVIDPSGRSDQAPSDPFVPVRDFNPPTLTAGGVTPMVEALEYAFKLVATKKQALRTAGVPLANRPLVYLITDGAPTDADGRLTDRWRTLVPVIRQHEAGRHLLFFALGVRGADITVLQGLAPQSALLLADLEFTRVLQFVSTSIETANTAATRDKPAAQVYVDIREANDRHERIRQWLQPDRNA
jgi:uncharacterized protein YegL